MKSGDLCLVWSNGHYGRPSIGTFIEDTGIMMSENDHRTFCRVLSGDKIIETIHLMVYSEVCYKLHLERYDRKRGEN